MKDGLIARIKKALGDAEGAAELISELEASAAEAIKLTEAAEKRATKEERQKMASVEDLTRQVAEMQAKLQAAESKAAEAETARDGLVREYALKEAAQSAGLRDLDALKMLDTSALKLGKDGKIEGGAAAFDAFKAAKSYLFGAAEGAQATEGAASPANPDQTASTPGVGAAPKPGDTRGAATQTLTAEQQADQIAQAFAAKLGPQPVGNLGFGSAYHATPTGAPQQAGTPNGFGTPAQQAGQGMAQA